MGVNLGWRYKVQVRLTLAGRPSGAWPAHEPLGAWMDAAARTFPTPKAAQRWINRRRWLCTLVTRWTHRANPDARFAVEHRVAPVLEGVRS